jgi:hypothetical protein
MRCRDAAAGSLTDRRSVALSPVDGRHVPGNHQASQHSQWTSAVSSEPGNGLAAPRVHQQPHGHRHRDGAPVSRLPGGPMSADMSTSRRAGRPLHGQCPQVSGQVVTSDRLGRVAQDAARPAAVPRPSYQVATSGPRQSHQRLRADGADPVAAHSGTMTCPLQGSDGLRRAVDNHVHPHSPSDAQHAGAAAVHRSAGRHALRHPVATWPSRGWRRPRQAARLLSRIPPGCPQPRGLSRRESASGNPPPRSSTSYMRR